MLGVRNAYVFGCWICILVGRGDVLDVVWVVLSGGENIGSVATLEWEGGRESYIMEVLVS